MWETFETGVIFIFWHYFLHVNVYKSLQNFVPFCTCTHILIGLKSRAISGKIAIIETRTDFGKAQYLKGTDFVLCIYSLYLNHDL